MIDDKPVVKIAFEKDFDVEVLQHSLNDNFAEHRNFAISKVGNNEWIIMIDGDEIVDSDFIKRLDEVLNANPAVEALSLARINTYGDELEIPAVDWSNVTGDQYPDFQARVFKKTPVIKYVGNVHEQLTNYTLKINTTDKELTIIHHKSNEKHKKSNEYYQVLQSMR
jgi:hypothetical protein